MSIQRFRLGAIILVLHLCFFGISLSAHDALDEEHRHWLEEHGPIILAVDSQNPPMNYLNESGKMQGMTINYMDLISEKLGVSIEYSPAPWKESLEKALNHQVDGIINASVTEERKASLNFTQSYFNTPDALLSRASQPVFRGPQSFDGKTIAVIEGSVRKGVLLNYSANAVILEVADLEEGVAAVVDGRADGLLDEMPVIQNLTERFFLSNVRMNCLIFFPELGSAHIGLRKDQPELVEILDWAIEHISLEERQQIQDAYQPDVKELHVLRDPGFSAEERLWLQQHPIITVGADEAWAPMQFSDKGNASGISQDYLQLLSEITGVEFVVEQGEWHRILDLAKGRSVDILSCARSTPDREVYLDFTDSYLDIPVVMLSRPDLSFVDNERGLRKYRLGLLNGYAAEELFRDTYPKLDYQSFPNLDEGVNALLSGKIDILIENQQAINYYIAQKGLYGLQIVGEMPFSYELGIGVRDDWPELVSIINKSFHTIDEDTRQDILQNWNYVTLRREVDYKKIVLMLLVFSIILSLLLIWNLWIARTVRLRTRQLEEARRMEAIGNIAGGIAHDFKNILMGVSGYTELLQQGASREEKEIYLNEILKAVDNGTALSNQILMYSKGSEKDFKLLDLSEICHEMLGFLQKSSKIAVSIDSLIEEHCELYGDSTQLKQLILNLGTNALQAMMESPQKKLTFRLEKHTHRGAFTIKKKKISGPLIILMIADTGCGIDKSHQSRIFDPYYTTRAREKGTGLGLATVDRIVKNHNGAIELYSQPNRGTSFTIYLPI